MKGTLARKKGFCYQESIGVCMDEKKKYFGVGHIVDYNLQEELCHGMYVSNLSYELTKELGEEEDFCQAMALAGIFHDIGKLKLNRCIYDDEETLMIEEMKYVRMHSKLSFDILKEKGYSRALLEAVLHHHENYDGSGYPDNLQGQHIPYGARILRVCDVFAALTQNRPYRKSFTREGAMELMIEEVKNFDLRIFLAFQRVIHEKTLEQPKLNVKELFP